MRLEIRNKIEYDNLFFCLSVIFSMGVYHIVKMVGAFTGSFQSIIMFILYGIMALTAVKVIPRIIKLINLRDLILVFFLVVMFSLSAFSSLYDTDIANQEIVKILEKCFPVYLGVKLVHYSPNLNKYLRVSAYILVLSVLSNSFLFGAKMEKYSQYDGYMLLNAFALLFVPLFSERKIYDIIAVAVIMITALLTGARGPMLFCAALTVSGFFLTEKRGMRKVIRYVILLVLIGITCKYIQDILQYVILRFGDLGSLRTINLLLNNQFMRSDGRINIIICALEYIFSHCFIGCGIVNERVIIYRETLGTGEISGYYPHNFFLEVGMQFGLIIGIVISCGVIWLIIRRFAKCEEIHEKLFMTALFFAGFAPLMVSCSYLSWPMFYALICFCMRQNRFGTAVSDK